MLCPLLLFCYVYSSSFILFFFFFNDTATTEIYPLSLHDPLPISLVTTHRQVHVPASPVGMGTRRRLSRRYMRSEEHTSELQSRLHLVCRLLLEKKKKTKKQSSILNANTDLVSNTVSQHEHATYMV